MQYSPCNSVFSLEKKHIFENVFDKNFLWKLTFNKTICIPQLHERHTDLKPKTAPQKSKIRVED